VLYILNFPKSTSVFAEFNVCYGFVSVEASTNFYEICCATFP
jgi:hypothetical protein